MADSVTTFDPAAYSEPLAYYYLAPETGMSFDVYPRIRTVEDLFGNGYDLEASSTGPQLQDEGAYFEGGEYLQVDPGLAADFNCMHNEGDSATIHVVFRPINAERRGTLVTNRTNAGGFAARGLSISYDNVGHVGRLSWAVSNGTTLVASGSTPDGAVVAGQDHIVTLRKMILASAEQAAPVHHYWLYVNGQLVDTWAVGSISPSDDDASAFTIGALSDGPGGFEGHIKKVAVYRDFHSQAQVLEVQEGLVADYGITLTTADPVLLHVLWGQSNLVGPSDIVDSDYSVGDTVAGGKIYNPDSGAYEDLQIGTNNQTGEATITKIGQEAPLMVYANSRDASALPYYMIKVGARGTGIDTFQDLSSSTGQIFWRTIYRGIEELEAMGYWIQEVHLGQVHGERDSLATETAITYLEKLRNMYGVYFPTYLRSYAPERLAIVKIAPTDPNYVDNLPTVQAALLAYSIERPNSFFLDRPISLQSDNLHFDWSSTKASGEDMAAALFDGVLNYRSNPQDTEGMVNWLDGTDGSHLLQADGNNVVRMVDRSGNNNHAEAVNDANRPTFESDADGNYVSFNGTNQYLRVNEAIAEGEYRTRISIMRIPADLTVGAFIFGAVSDDNRAYTLYDAGSNSPVIRVYNGVLQGSLNYDYTPGKWMLVVEQHGPEEYYDRIQVDGGYWGSGVSGTLKGSAWHIATNGAADSIRFSQLDVRAVLTWNRNLSTPEVDDLVILLSEMYGVTLVQEV